MQLSVNRVIYAAVNDGSERDIAKQNVSHNKLAPVAGAKGVSP